MNHVEVKVVGVVESSLTDVNLAPRQADESAPEASLVFDEEVREALRNIRPGDKLIVLTWLHRAQRNVMRVHPRGDLNREPEGVFSTRSPHRPNPVGLHQVEVTDVDGLRLRVRSLEAVDGTPIIDLKPVLADEVDRR
jgi:tRNA-Thr(GGU) m(6)t(6)A37 methyltransferase TsaA